MFKNLKGADFAKANLNGADLSRVILERTIFIGADITGVDFTVAIF